MDEKTQGVNEMNQNTSAPDQGSGAEDSGIFRKKSMETLSSPENLNDYLRVTNPAVWVVLLAVIMFLFAVIVWANFTSFESYATGKAFASDNVLTITFDSEDAAKFVEPGMIVSVGDTTAEIKTVGRAAEGQVIGGAEANVPDGEYEVKVRFKSTRIMSLLFNR